MNSTPRYPGARWWKFDFHTHTPASRDTKWFPFVGNEKELAPEEWLLQFMEGGIDCVAVTDHNSGAWIDKLKDAYARMKSEAAGSFRSLHLFPGVEISVNGGFHLLAIFDPSKGTSDIDSLLGAVDYDGTKGDSDGVTRKSAVEVVEAVFQAGGLAIPAHVDSPKGLFEAKSKIPTSCKIDSNTIRQVMDCDQLQGMEVVGSSFQEPGIYIEKKLDWSHVLGTDYHGKERNPQPGDQYTWVKMAEPGLEALRLALHDGRDFAVKRSLDCPADFRPNDAPENWIESLEIEKARLMGQREKTVLRFSPWLNALIGGRGSGKSTVVHFVRLTTERDDDFGSLGENNTVKRAFDNFVHPPRGQDGGLTPETTASLTYRKGTERFRLNWGETGAPTVQEWEDLFTGDWVNADSQDVLHRFPVTIFSQDQISLMAESPLAILQKIDEAIGRADWQVKWDQLETNFLSELAEIRSCDVRLGEKDRLLAEKSDLTAKLKVFEESEHAGILKSFRKRRRQRDEVEHLLKSFHELGTEIEELESGSFLPDLSEGLVDSDDPKDLELAGIKEVLDAHVDQSNKTLLDLTKEFREIEAAQRVILTSGSWQRTFAKASEAQVALIQNLKEQGVDDPEEFSRIGQRKLVVEKALEDLKTIELKRRRCQDAAKQARAGLLELRLELQSMRKTFLDEQKDKSPYVRIELVEFGSDLDADGVEADLRSVLNCEGSRFASAIRDSENDRGIIETLYQNLSASGLTLEKRRDLITTRLEEFKKSIRTAVRGDDSTLPVAFASFLKKEKERKNEVFDRLHIWWPEDSLNVKYSKDGRGKKFTSLKNGSAGEKAAALLAFFLVYGEDPLIIDQPENDLDNQLITDLVVKQLKANKTRRQIIVVSHNPNIVVNGDAEMVHAMAYAEGQCGPSEQGSLQDAEVREQVCKVMEGGAAALKKRYQRLI